MSLDIRGGIEDFFRPYSATILPTTTQIERMEQGYYNIRADYEIIVSAARLARDNVDAQLGNTEREIMRIICQYEKDDIDTIHEMYYRGQERIYGIDSNYAKSNWATRIFLTMRYEQNALI